MKKVIAISTMLIASIAFSQQHIHVWIKQNQQRGYDASGNPVIICSWHCVTSGHFTQTQGFGFCPMPLS